MVEATLYLALSPGNEEIPRKTYSAMRVRGSRIGSVTSLDSR